MLIAISISEEDARLLEARIFIIEEICRLFSIPVEDAALVQTG